MADPYVNVTTPALIQRFNSSPKLRTRKKIYDVLRSRSDQELNWGDKTFRRDMFWRMVFGKRTRRM